MAAPASALPLQGRRFDFSSSPRLADAYAASLLAALGATVAAPAFPDPLDASRDWAASGLLPLNGHVDGPPLMGPAAIATCANGALGALRTLAARPLLGKLDGARLLSERAAYLNLQRQGPISANGSCRLLACTDGWLALNLARADDWNLLPAWLECATVAHDWDSLATRLRLRATSELIARGRLLGLAVAEAVDPSVAIGEVSPPWWRRHSDGPKRMPAIDAMPLVIDLSSLWAGPLAGHLLLEAGARVIKVESQQRPDGARFASKDFYDLLNAGKASVAIDFASAAGRAQLHALLCRADIVIESSRPRALAQLGICAEEMLAQKPGLTWISITAYGRKPPQADWIGFGDDAACAAGLTLRSGQEPLFCGDALVDPLTGLHAALAALAFWQAGGGVLLDIPLAAVGAHCLQFQPSMPAATIRRQDGDWHLAVANHSWPIELPRQRPGAGRAAELGEDTAGILTGMGIPC